MQDKKPDVPVSDGSNLVIVATPEYVKEAIAEHAASRNHPYATQTEPGFVTLNNDANSDSEITAATSKSVKKAYDLANSANQNASSANDNANTRLSKDRNGADIPDKTNFLKNIGLGETANVRFNDVYVNVLHSSILNLTGNVSGVQFYSPDGSGRRRRIERALDSDPVMFRFIDRAGDAENNRNIAVIEMPRVTYGQVLVLRGNCINDPNGYIRIASPIIEIFSSGAFTTNDESEGTTVEYLSKGTYLIKGIKGFSNDGTVNNIDIPRCQNDLPMVWVNHEVLPDGSIKLMTYHREHSDAPAFARNIREGYSDGDLIDIPDGRFVSVRVQMPDAK
ncbi:tail protein [Xenorhabdus stockiae]|uniref:Tail protein n=1 Tax=Xenorhabdus stockiae TaxID=351614 RepID=A0A2D0KLN1_9GAMM|nr:phage tail protein [Xenorhabdus stockiae]PHM64137.1 tail protein [Xenorhabdus stockiae]